MIDDNTRSPTAHLPDLFRRALRTGLAKGGAGVGGSTPLLPWVGTGEVAAQDDGISVPELGDPLPTPDPSAPAWLRLACAPESHEGKTAPGAYSIRALSHVGFGFGLRRPW